MSLPWAVGQLVASRYRLDEPLGSGAAAEVWRAFDENLQAPVAIKLLDPSFAGSTVAKRFIREARAAAQLRSLHVVQILDHGEDATTAYITMELLDGETLADRLDRVERLAPQKTVKVVQDVAKATTKAHEAGIVHRDLKPANVFLVAGEEGDDELAKVFDFGIAKVQPTEGVAMTGATKAGTLLGTPSYMSPEQASGAPVDHRTDLYALGILTFECLTGRLPFDTDEMSEILSLVAYGKLKRPSSMMPGLPRAFDAWFAKATCFKPEGRFESARDLAAALRSVLLG